MAALRELLENRNFVLLWLALVISTLGNVMYNVGVMVTVFERTGSALQTIGVTLAINLPPFFLGPFAGVLVDRYPRKWVMVFMDLLRAALVGLLLLFMRNQAVSIGGIYLIVAGLAVATTFYEPARRAIVPALVAKTTLVRANSWLMTSNQATLALGYAFGGLLFLAIGFRAVVSLDLLTFGFAAAAVAFISVSEQAREASTDLERPFILQQMKDGWTYLKAHPLARSLTTMEILEHVPHAIWTSALMLVFTEQALNSNADGWGYQISSFNGGQLAGAAVATLLAVYLARRPGQIIIWNAFIFGFLTLVYALSPNLSVAIVVCFLFGPSWAMRDVAQDSLLQASVQAHVLGRVYAMRTTLANLSYILAGAAFAWTADHLVSTRWVYLIGGLLYLATALYALLNTAIRHSTMGQHTATTTP